jgi:hypothetical protein
LICEIEPLAVSSACPSQLMVSWVWDIARRIVWAMRRAILFNSPAENLFDVRGEFSKHVEESPGEE